MGGIDKMFASLGGEPVVLRTLRAFQASHIVDEIIVVVSKEREKRCRSLVTSPAFTKVKQVCTGGQRRQDSVAAGLAAAGDCHWIVIHDGARPLVTVDLIERGLEAAQETGAAAAAIPVTDTIKVIGPDGMVLETPPRQNLRAVQTPQVFRSSIIRQAYRQASGEVTDDAALVEGLGRKVKLYHGAVDNIKITYPADLALAELLLQEREK